MFQGMISNIFKTVLNTDLGEFPVMAYADAMHRFGSDKPDLRVSMAENASCIVPPKDPAALAAALDRLIADAALRARVGTRNRARCAAEFPLQARLGAHLALYDEVLAARR